MKGSPSLRAIRAYSELGIARGRPSKGDTLRSAIASNMAAIGLIALALAIVTALAVAIDVRTRVSVAAVGWLYLLIVLPVTLRWGRAAGLLTAAVAAFLLITFLTEPRGLPYTRSGIDLIRLLLSVSCVAAAVLLVHPAVRERTEEDRNLVAVAASSDEATVSIAPDGTVLAWSTGAARIFGYALADMLSQPFSILSPSGWPYSLAEINARFERGERSLQLETQGLACGGRLLDIVLTLTPRRDMGGTLSGATAHIQDVTARRRIEQAVRTGNEAIERAMQELPLGLLVLDDGGRILTANDQADSLLRLGSKSPQGRLVNALFADQFTMHPALLWNEVLRAGDAKFLAVDASGIPSGLHVAFSQLAIEAPFHSARYLATLRDATPDLQEAREQFLTQTSPRAMHYPALAPAPPPTDLALPALTIVSGGSETKVRHLGELDAPTQHGLTNREIEVLSLVASSRSNQEIAEELGISLNTVERHVANIYRKLNIRGRVHATAYALQHGLTPPYGS